MWLILLALASAPEVKLPPKREIIPTLGSERPQLSTAIRAGVKAARRELEKCFTVDAGPDCVCKALKQVRFDVTLDAGTVTITYPLIGHTGPSFTIDASGKVIDCRP
jgi:hypothetical protein